MEEQFVCVATFANEDTYTNIMTLDDIAQNIFDTNPKRRYFKIPPIESLEEVKVELLVKSLSV